MFATPAPTLPLEGWAAPPHEDCPVPGRFSQPPPSFRSARAGPPLFPVPPPGSCLLPPPPLPLPIPVCPEPLLVSPAAAPAGWGDSERWRKPSWEGGATPASPALYSYQRSGSSTTVRPRTLLEVPILQSEDCNIKRSLPRPILSTEQPVNQSRLDPNSQPFTPASCHSAHSPDCTGEVWSAAGANCSYTQSPASPGLQQRSSPLHLSSLSCQDSSLNKTDSKLEDAVMAPYDLKLLLPELDMSHEESKEERVKETGAATPTALKTLLTLCSESSIIPPPIFPFASHWSGKARPPLLPTPKNFPPFGPRQAPSTPIFEEDLQPASISSHTEPAETPSCDTFGLSRFTIPAQLEDVGSGLCKESTGESFHHRKKPNIVSWLSHFDFDRPTIGAEKEEHEAQSASFLAWEAGLPELEPSSLLDSQPVPDEYLLTKVVGAKLPAVKLQNCHTVSLLH